MTSMSKKQSRSSVRDQLNLKVDDLLGKLRPTRQQIELRKKISLFVSSIVEFHFSQLSPVIIEFGSVPLRTFLPEADLDLTFIPTSDFLQDQKAQLQTLSELQQILQQQNSQHSFFRFTDLNLVNADVKLLKMKVNNIQLDISINQLGGVFALALLQECDE